MATLLCGISSLFADDTDARLQVYKANRLIPQEFSLAGNNSDSEVMFSKSSLSWNTSGAISQALKSELAKMNAQELLDFIKAKEGGQTALDYLAALANGSETSANISTEEAKADILALITEFTQAGDNGGSYWTPQSSLWDGVLDISGIDFDFGKRNPGMCTDLSCIKMTGAQFASLSAWYESILPEITGFTGNEDFSHWSGVSYADLSKVPGFTKEQFFSIKNMFGSSSPDTFGYIAPKYDLSGSEDLSGCSYRDIDFSGCSGMTGSQFLQASFNDCKLPEITFSGSEDFSAVSLSGMDLSTSTGVSTAQIKQAVHPYEYTTNPFDGMKMTSAQFNAWKDTLSGAVWRGTTTTVYVDGVETEIEGSYSEDF